MTKRTLNLNELAIIAGGAVEIAEDGANPADDKASTPIGSGNAGSPGTNSGLDTEIFGQDNNL